MEMVQEHYSLGEESLAQSGSSQVVERRYAGFWIRLAAFVIDFFVIMVFGSIIALISFFAVLKGGDQKLWYPIIDIVVRLIMLLYFIYFTYKYNATLGKKAVGIMVIPENSEKLTLGRVIIRETIGKWVSAIILFLGFIMAGFTFKKQALHDKLVGTVVVYK